MFLDDVVDSYSKINSTHIKMWVGWWDPTSCHSFTGRSWANNFYIDEICFRCYSKRLSTNNSCHLVKWYVSSIFWQRFHGSSTCVPCPCISSYNEKSAFNCSEYCTKSYHWFGAIGRYLVILEVTCLTLKCGMTNFYTCVEDIHINTGSSLIQWILFGYVSKRHGSDLKGKHYRSVGFLLV